MACHPVAPNSESNRALVGYSFNSHVYKAHMWRRRRRQVEEGENTNHDTIHLTLTHSSDAPWKHKIHQRVCFHLFLFLCWTLSLAFVLNLTSRRTFGLMCWTRKVITNIWNKAENMYLSGERSNAELDGIQFCEKRRCHELHTDSVPYGLCQWM